MRRVRCEFVQLGFGGTGREDVRDEDCRGSGPGFLDGIADFGEDREA